MRVRPGRERADRPAIPQARIPALREALDAAYAGFAHAGAAADPVEVGRRYENPTDREIAGFIASALAFGRVASVLQAVDHMLAVMAPSPCDYVVRFDPARDRRQFDALGHRWTRGRDLAALVLILQRLVAEYGSLESCFVRGDDPSAPDIGSGLEAFSSTALAVDLRPAYGNHPPPCPGVAYFFAKPSTGSACKRLNLFLRWMVRNDAVDFGLWKRVSPARLVIPLDTHVIRLSKCLRLTRYQSPGWRMALDITKSLRLLDPADPVKYDFSLCHLGMMDACGFRRAYRDERCPLRAFCHPGGARRRQSSRPASGRR